MERTLSREGGGAALLESTAEQPLAGESPTTIALVLLLVGAPAASVTAADWADYLGWLPVFGAGGVLFALFLSRRKLPAPVAHLVALSFGVGFVALYFLSAADRGNLLERMVWLTVRIGAWADAAVSGGASSDTLLFSLTMSLLAWFLGYASGWFAFRERAPWWAILPNGCAILINLSYAPPELLPFLVVFLLAALLLLIDLTLQRRAERWGGEEPALVGTARHLMLAGAIISGSLLMVAWVLPSGGISQKVSEMWYDMTGPWQAFQSHFDRLFAALNAPERSARGLNFGRTLAPRAAFELGEQPVLAISAREPRYWRAATYDRYTGQLFVSSEPNTVRVEAEETRTTNVDKAEARQEFEQRVQLLASQTTMLFAADAPERASLPTFYDYREVPDDFVALRLTTPLRRGQQYNVVSSVSVATVNDLRSAGGEYPGWASRYLQLPRSVPARVRQEARRVTANAETAYDKATAIESYLRQFRYSTHVKQPPPDRDWVDYMLFESREGYCDYYASAMAVMLRAVDIPARVVSGFAPGDRDAAQDLIIVKESHAHSWTEAYFPHYGWINFEPSALRPVPPRLESFGLDGSLGWDLFGFEDEDYGDFDFEGLGAMVAPSDASPPTDASELPGVVVGLLYLLVGLLVAALAAAGAAIVLACLWQRSLGSLRAYIRPYAQLCAVASWCGLAQRPSDTPYEYARVLGSEVPPARGQVQAIADAYVRGTYGRAAPEGGVSEQAADAWKGTRLLLVRTLLRRHWRQMLNLRRLWERR
jgi:transglutaminase-like putative cysteine protease